MLTVAILNYNGNDTLRESIQSVLDQTLKPERFVVIDNASTDGSRQIAVDMGVEVVDADNRHQFITGLNKAFSLCEDKLLFMQNDVILEKYSLEKMLAYSPYHKFIAQPIIYQQNGKIDNSGMDIFWPGYGIRRNKEWWTHPFLAQNCGLVTTICFLIDKLTINLLEGYDINFSPAYYEDLDFFIRSKKFNIDHVLIPSATAIHRGNHTFSQRYTKKLISIICRKHRRKLIRKHYRGFDRLLRLTVATCLDMVKEIIDRIIL